MSNFIILAQVDDTTEEAAKALLNDPAFLALMNRHGLHWSDMTVIEGEIQSLYTEQNQEATS